MDHGVLFGVRLVGVREGFATAKVDTKYSHCSDSGVSSLSSKIVKAAMQVGRGFPNETIISERPASAVVCYHAKHSVPRGIQCLQSTVRTCIGAAIM